VCLKGNKLKEQGPSAALVDVDDQSEKVDEFKNRGLCDQQKVRPV
jgi:hypothetical protein